MTQTELTLLAIHRAPAVPLADICERYFNIKPKVADRRARLNQLPVPAWRLGTQKSPFMVHVKDLAERIDTARESAAESWKKSQL